jgi:hypothetical protein
MPARTQNLTDSASPPVPPQMPTLRSLRVLGLFDAHLDQHAHAGLIEALERVGLEDGLAALFLVHHVGGQEAAGVVPREARVICVRSLVPKLKNSATSAIWSASRAARGISIMVPTM